MKSGENIQLVTRAVKSCLDTNRPVTLDARNREIAENLANLIEWLGYGKLVYTKVQQGQNWQVVVVKR
jgi:hypothetical protein